MRSGHRRIIIIIITTTPFEVEGREVGCPTVYEGYIARYIVGFCVVITIYVGGCEVGVPRFMKGIWYGILLGSV